MKLNDEGSGAVPVLLFIITIIAAGALYTLLFITIFYKVFAVLIPDSVFKSVIVWGAFYYAPIVIIVVGILWVVQMGLKESQTWSVDV